MSEIVHIIGHKNPDTDSIVASLAYAQLKNSLHEEAIACRIGDINQETAFVLKRFQANEPVYIQNAKVKLYDVVFDEALSIQRDATIKEAWNRMQTAKRKAIYVVDREECLLGVVSVSDITKILMNERSHQSELMKHCEVENICKVLDGEYLVKSNRYRTSGEVHILSSHKALYSELDFRQSIVVLSDDFALQQRVIRDGASCVILVDVDILSPSIVRLAKEYDCALLRTPFDMLMVARNIYKAPSVEHIMGRKIISFYNHEYIDTVFHKMSKTRYRSYPVLNNQGKVLGSIARYHLLNYQKKKLILVDHNELSQSIDYISEAEVLEIVDHHRIGDVETSYPIKFRNEIIGSTCSIVAEMYEENHIVPDEKMAALMCCAIISDTMNFNSVTTTPKDIEIAKRLAKIARIDLAITAKEMFTSVATLSGRSNSEILYNDFKEYNIDGKRIAIGQINISDEQELLVLRDDFLAYMETINTINKFDLLMMCFSDVQGCGSNLLFVGDMKWVVDEAFKDEIMDDLYFVNGVLSRKKQIIPTLAKALSQ